MVALGKKVTEGMRRPLEAQLLRGLLVLRVGGRWGRLFSLLCNRTVITRHLARRVWKAEGLLRQEGTPEGLTDCTTLAQTLPAFLKVLLGQRT